MASKKNQIKPDIKPVVKEKYSKVCSKAAIAKVEKMLKDHGRYHAKVKDKFAASSVPKTKREMSAALKEALR